MKYSITIVECGSYTYIKPLGTIGSFECLQQFAQDLILTAKEYACPNFLLDVREMQYHFSMFELILWGENLVHLGFQFRGYRIASVRSESNFRQGSTVETVLNNRSISYRAFMSITQAERWLDGKIITAPGPWNAPHLNTITQLKTA